MDFATKLYQKPVEATDRLNYLGLNADILLQAVEFGLGYLTECTNHDPPSGRGIITWMKTTRMLRDLLIPHGWTKENSQNYATTVHPSKGWAIAVSQGDSRTGNPDMTPATRAEKGPATEKVVSVNQSGFASISADPNWRSPERQTWILLLYQDEDADEVRAELSLPVVMNPEGYITEWSERIMLSSPDSRLGADLNPAALGGGSADDDSGDIDIPVELKA